MFSRGKVDVLIIYLCVGLMWHVICFGELSGVVGGLIPSCGNSQINHQVLWFPADSMDPFMRWVWSGCMLCCLLAHVFSRGNVWALWMFLWVWILFMWYIIYLFYCSVLLSCSELSPSLASIWGGIVASWYSRISSILDLMIFAVVFEVDSDYVTIGIMVFVVWHVYVVVTVLQLVLWRL